MSSDTFFLMDTKDMITVPVNSKMHFDLMEKGWTTVWQGNGIAKLEFGEIRGFGKQIGVGAESPMELYNRVVDNIY